MPFQVGQRVRDPQGNERIVRNIFNDGRVELEPLGGAVTEGTSRTLPLPPRPNLPTLGSPPPRVRPELNTGAPLPADQPFSREELASEGMGPRNMGVQETIEPIKRIGRVMAETFDPRTPEGRNNIMSEVGAAGGAWAIGGPIGSAMKAGKTVGRVARAARVLSPVLGAGAGAAAEAGVEAALGQPPPRSLTGLITGEEPESITGRMLTAGVEQGGMEALGAGMLWLPRAIGRRFFQFPVSHHARLGIEDKRIAAQTAADQRVEDLANELTGLSARVSAGVRESRRVATRALDQVSDTTRAAVEAAQSHATQLGDEGIAALRTRGERGAAGTAVHEVMQGPASTVRNELGQNIERIAEQGPDLNILGLKDQAQDIFDREIKAVASEFSGVPKGQLQPEAQALVEQAIRSGVPEADVAKMTQQFIDAGLSLEAAEATIETAQHPAIKILRQVVAADDTVSFQAAHQMKKQLSEAIPSFTRRARTKTGQLTKAFRTSFNELLSEYKPYREANAAFSDLTDLMDTKLLTRLRDVAAESPEMLVDSIKAGDVTQMRLLRDFLQQVPGQASEQGAKMGDAAWDQVRRAWTDQTLLEDGIEGLGKRLDKLDPEMLAVVYGDETGQHVLSNMQALRQAYEQAAARVGDLKTAGRAEMRATRRAGEEAVDTARGRFGREKMALQQESALARKFRKELSKRTPEEFDFSESTLAHARQVEAIVTDAVRTFFLAPGGAWQLVSAVRLLRGPKGADLMRWAAYSPKSTQAVVEMLTGPEPGIALAALLRQPGFSDYFLSSAIDVAGLKDAMRDELLATAPPIRPFEPQIRVPGTRDQLANPPPTIGPAR